MNSVIKLVKRTHDVNKQKGIILAKAHKVSSSKIDSGIETIINEQSAIIEEYHKIVKEAISKISNLSNQNTYLKKQLSHTSIPPTEYRVDTIPSDHPSISNDPKGTISLTLPF